MSFDRLVPRQLSDQVQPPALDSFFLKRLWPKRLVGQIGYGYLTAIAVGWVGSIFGIVVADYFQGKAVFQLVDAQAQTRLLVEFEETAAHAQLQLLRTVSLSHNSDEALSSASADIASLAGLRQDLDTFLAQQPVWLAQDAEVLQSLLASYTEALQQYPAQLSPTVMNDAVAESGAPVSAIAATATLEQLQQDLAATIRVAQRQEAMAADMLESVQGLEKFIVIFSITAAGALAGLIAWRTTREIATPIENITQTARQVTHEGDYDVRAQIFHDDEVGTLAQSLNELIERVAERTQALEQAAETAVTQSQELSNTLQVLQKTQSQLVQSEKMSSLGQLVAGIAHEVNNPIGFIRGNLEYVHEYSDALFTAIDLLSAQTPDLDNDVEKALKALELDFIRQDFSKVLQSISNGTERINSLILSLKIFSRLQESQVKSANLNDGLESCLMLLGHRLKSQSKRPEVLIERHYGELPAVKCFSSQINQAFMNILTNALDAIDERWQIAPGNWQPELVIESEFRSNAVHVRIANNGLPIAPEVRKKIFDPFFTTKSVGAGVGLGLAVSYEIVCQKHQGTLTFASPCSGSLGTQFSLSIPFSPEASGATLSNAPSSPQELVVNGSGSTL